MRSSEREHPVQVRCQPGYRRPLECRKDTRLRCCTRCFEDEFQQTQGGTRVSEGEVNDMLQDGWCGMGDILRFLGPRNSSGEDKMNIGVCKALENENSTRSRRSVIKERWPGIGWAQTYRHRLRRALFTLKEGFSAVAAMSWTQPRST